MIFSLFRKTVFTGQITVMGNMKTKCFYYCLPLFKIKNVIFINIRRKQLSCRLQRQQLVHRFPDFLFRKGKIGYIQYRRPNGISIFHPFIDKWFYQGNHIIYNIVHHMDGPAVYIHYNVIPIALILMYHFYFPFTKFKQR